MCDEKKITYKIIMIGPTNAGKTSIINNIFYKNNKNISSTIGASYNKYVLNNDITLDFWDTAGQERFNSLLKLYYRGADVVVLVFDVVNYTKELTKIKTMIEEIETNTDNVKYILVGNKTDLLDDNINNIDNTIKDILKDYKISDIYYTSAKDNINITNLMTCIINNVKNIKKSAVNKTKNNIIKIETGYNYNILYYIKKMCY